MSLSDRPSLRSTRDEGSPERARHHASVPLAEPAASGTSDEGAPALARVRALLAAWVEVTWMTDAAGNAHPEAPENEFWQSATGQSAAAMHGWGWLDAITPGDRSRVRAAWADAKQAREPFRVTFHLRHHDGQERTMTARVVPVFNSRGDLDAWVAGATTLGGWPPAGRRQDDSPAGDDNLTSLVARAHELEVVFNAMTSGVIVYQRDGRISYVNARARQVLGITTVADYTSRPLAERARELVIRDALGRELTPDEWPQVRLLRGEVLTTENALEAYIHTVDQREIRISLSGAPLYHGEEIVGAVAVFDDVSALHQVERRTHDALGALIEMAESLIATEPALQGSAASAQRLVELTCQVMGCARASIHAIDPGDERIHPVAVVGLTPDEERHWWSTWRPGPRAGDILQGDISARLAAGEVVIADLSQNPVAPERNPYVIVTLLMAPMRVHERLVGILALDYGHSKHDYTEPEIHLAQAVAHLAALVIERDRLLREREAARARELALREANRRMDEFLSMASHELRNPLTSIKVNLQLADRRLNRQRAALPETAEALAAIQDLLGRSERQTEFLDRLVGDLLDVSRISAGKLEIKPAPTNLAMVVRDAVQAQRLANPARAITLALPECTVPVEADADRVGQVVTNYLTNALKYSPFDRPVAVELDVEGRQARVAVRDQGPGLPPEERDLVWERFHRVPGIVAQSGSGGGLGLGLHISRTLIERQGGTVGVESTPGQGSTFWFTLPIRRARKLRHVQP